MSGFFPQAFIKSEKVKQQPKLSTDQHKKPSHDTNMQNDGKADKISMVSLSWQLERAIMKVIQQKIWSGPLICKIT